MTRLFSLLICTLCMSTIFATTIPDLPQVTYTCADGEVQFTFNPELITPTPTVNDLYVVEIFRKEMKRWEMKTSKTPTIIMNAMNGVRYKEGINYRFAIIRNSISKEYFSKSIIISNNILNPIANINTNVTGSVVTISFLDPSNVEASFPYKVINTITNQTVITGEFPGQYGIGRNNVYQLVYPAGSYKIIINSSSLDQYGNIVNSIKTSKTFIIAPSANN